MPDTRDIAQIAETSDPIPVVLDGLRTYLLIFAGGGFVASIQIITAIGTAGFMPKQDPLTACFSFIIAISLLGCFDLVRHLGPHHDSLSIWQKIIITIMIGLAGFYVARGIDSGQKTLVQFIYQQRSDDLMEVIQAQHDAIQQVTISQMTPNYTITDGNTIRIGDERIRIIGLDTPEVSKSECHAEKMLGEQATRRLSVLLSSGTMTIERNGLDTYKRTLAVVKIDGEDVAPMMIAEGLAMKQRPKDGWCVTPSKREFN